MLFKLRFPAAIVVGMLLGFVLSGCPDNTKNNQAGEENLQTPGIKNVLLITLDTTRADSLGCYGNNKISTPNLDALAAEGIKFENAYADCPLTLPSHASMLTGMYPFTHGLRNNTQYILDSGKTTLAKLLRDNGYHTAAFIASSILDSNTGMNLGFESFFDDMASGLNPGEPASTEERRAGAVNHDFFEWLDSRNQGNSENSTGWFAWVHYYDPHYPYSPPEPFSTQYSQNPYLGEVAYMDDALGKILDRLRSDQRYDNTLIIAVGDHGEGLGQHNQLHHGYWTYNSTLRVPLIVSIPGHRNEPGTVNEPVSVIDIFPTILSWCGITVPSNPGIDLLSRDLERNSTGRSLYFESMEPRITLSIAGLRGVIEGNKKYICSPIPEYYDLQADPDEITNLYEQNMDDADAMKNRMLQLVDQWRPADNPIQRQITPEELASLGSLGYLAGGSVSTEWGKLEDTAGLPDIKTKSDVVALIERDGQEAAAAIQAGDNATAIAKYREILQYGELYAVATTLARLLMQEGNQDEAIQLF